MHIRVLQRCHCCCSELYNGSVRLTYIGYTEKLSCMCYHCFYTDFQKAFDKVPHQRILLKLQRLTDRRQRVVVDGEVSIWKSVLIVVPQGSVLGPLLFLIYINDLDGNITRNALKFAYDTKVFRKVNNDGDKQHLQNYVRKLIKWYKKGRCY